MIRPSTSARLLLCALLSGTAAAQEPTFTSQSNVVLVPALVKGEDGRAVYGLEAKDFVIEDDGVDQKISLDEAAEEEPVSVIVAIQCGREAKHELPRMQGLSSMLDPILSQPRNRIALVEFDTQVNLVQDFTNDSSLIEQGLKNLQPGDTGAAIYDAVNYSVNLLNKLPDAGQRVLLLISETRDHGSHWGKLDDIVAVIGDSNTAVYALAFSPHCRTFSIPSAASAGTKPSPVLPALFPSLSWRWRPCVRMRRRRSHR